jgi:pimeloyl-ACP methyl ester carboxylesterase
MKSRTLAASLILATAVAAATAVGVSWRAAAREAAAERDFPPEGQFVEVDGQRVHAVVRGAGPDLVLIHGSSGNTRDFTFGFVGRISDRYRVIVFDRPGLGWSDRLPKGAEGIHAQAARLRAAARALGAERPIVLGQSYGAAVALAWALDAPDSVAAVVNVSGPSHPWPGPLPGLYRVTSHPLGAALVVPLITAFVDRDYVSREIATVFDPQPMPDGYAAAIGAPLTLRRGSMRANASHRATLKDEITAMVPLYPGFPVPLEIVHGDADTTVDLGLHAEAMLRDTPQARLARLDGVGHMPHHTHAAAVIAAIDRAAARAGLR